MQRPFDIEQFLISALAEDIGGGDLTSRAVIPEDATAKLVMRAREPIVLAGATFLPVLFSLIDEKVKVELQAEDGASLKERAMIATLAGPARALLAGERVALNLVQQLSGIATLTQSFVKAVEGTGVKILDTRKTTPGLRYLQKYAVRCGGGHNHRMGLYDAVLIKDNHLAIAGAVKTAVKLARENTPRGTPVEVECDTLAQVKEAVAAKADIVLLDNMDIAMLHKAASYCKSAGISTEASGNVSLDTVRAIAESGVDSISIGKLTHSARAVDIGLDDT